MKNRKPKGYWTKERCQIEALKYDNRSDFKENGPSAYNISLKNKWLDVVCSHINNKIKDKGYWTKERCQTEALKYDNRSDFKEKNQSAYNISLKNKWLDEIVSHMKNVINPPNYWTKERCQIEALKYDNRSDFKEKSATAYNKTITNHWIDVCSHMKLKQKPKGYWTKERCQIEALKYNSKIEFKKNHGSAYKKVVSMKWINEICLHMINEYIESKRCIYVHKFLDNCVYVGLTNNLTNRTHQHYSKKIGNNSVVYKHYKEIGEKSTVKQLTNYVNEKEAQRLENFYVKLYQIMGWKILNIQKSGNLGSKKRKWTKEKCQIEALKYNNRTIFSKKSGSAYNSARKNDWLEEICSHMIKKKIRD